MAPRTPKSPDDKPAKPGKADKPARAAGAKPALKVVEKGDSGAGAVGPVKLKDLVDTVVAATGAKKPEVKKTVEATLSALAQVLGAGKPVAVPALGKLRVVKRAGPMLTLKLRLPEAGEAGGKPLAEDGEDS